jgi:hypothetical protein
MKWSFLIVCIFLIANSCYQPERDCKAFKYGTFTFTSTINNEEKTTTFVRYENIEIDFYEGKSDTSSLRWINDCEYIVKKIKPRNRAEEKSIHIKIRTTTDSSYTFEYGIVGETNKSVGTAIKIK